MKKRFVFYGALIILLIMAGCQTRPQERSCDIKDLLLDKDDFPFGTILELVDSPISDLPQESAGRTASYNQDLIYVEVARYRSLRDAKSKFNELNQFLFTADKYSGPWSVPATIADFIPKNADQFQYACSKSSHGYQCRMVARYEEYIASLFADISDQGITLDRYRILMVNLDNRISKCLNEK